MRGSIVGLLLPIVLATAVLAAPAVGERLPDVRAKDVDGAERHLLELLHEGPTLGVAITDRGAADKMRAWFDASDERVPGVNRVSVVSIGVPFFVSDDYARSKAREQVPERWRGKSLFDSDGTLAKELGLGKGETPWVFVVDAQGRIEARVHGTPDDPAAEAIWKALHARK